MNDVPQPIDDPGTVKIDTRCAVRFQGIEACALREGILRASHSVSAQSLEQRMPRSDPL